MAVVYATLIIKGVKTIDDVPARIKDKVVQVLIDLDCGDLAGRHKSITHSKASCRNAWCLFYAERKINKMNIKEGICTGIGVIGSIIASAFGGWDTGLVTLLIFMGIDYFSGLVVAGVFHKSNKTESGALESKAGWKGLCRKCMTLLFVLIAYRLDLAIGVDYIRNAVIIGFMANELISIVENAGLMGLPLPDAINKAIDVLTEQKEG